MTAILLCSRRQGDSLQQGQGHTVCHLHKPCTPFPSSGYFFLNSYSVDDPHSLVGIVGGLKKDLKEDILSCRFQRLLTAFWKHENGIWPFCIEVKAMAWMSSQVSSDKGLHNYQERIYEFPGRRKRAACIASARPLGYWRSMSLLDEW